MSKHDEKLESKIVIRCTRKQKASYVRQMLNDNGGNLESWVKSVLDAKAKNAFE